MSFGQNHLVIPDVGTDLYVQVALVPSNTWAGRSQALAAVYEHRVAQDGDVILDLVGGRFVVDDDGARTMRFTEPKRHLFEHGGNPDPVPDTACSEPWEGTWPGRAHVPILDAPPAGARTWGGLPDWVVER